MNNPLYLPVRETMIAKIGSLRRQLIRDHETIEIYQNAPSLVGESIPSTGQSVPALRALRIRGITRKIINGQRAVANLKYRIDHPDEDHNFCPNTCPCHQKD